MTITPEETPMPSPLTGQQLDDIQARANDYAEGHTHLKVLCGPACAMATAVPALVAEVRRLRARVTELEGNLGTPVLGGVPLPPRDSGYERMERARAELDKGFTDQEWAVGRIVCPEGFSCVSHPLTVFTPTKRGRLPVHRHEKYGDACRGSGQKPTTPPLRLRAAPVSA